MIISINQGFDESTSFTSFNNYLSRVLIQLARDNPAHSFIMSNMAPVEESLPENVSVTESSPAGIRLWWQIFFKKKTRKDELLIACFPSIGRLNGNSCILITDLSMLAHPSAFNDKEIRRFKKTLGRVLRSSKAVWLPSLFYRQLLIDHFQLPAEKTQLLNLNIRYKLLPLTDEEKEKVKSQYTGGLEYFLFAGDIHPRHELIVLLKAFSDFKKWQRSNMKLVIAGHKTGWAVSNFQNMVSTYKYRDDVVLVTDASFVIHQQLAGAAYCFVYPARYDPFPWNVMLAMWMQSPVITYDIPEIREVAGEAVLYAEAGESGLSAAMQQLYKDEGRRASIIAKARDHWREENKEAAVFKNRMLLTKLIG